MASTSCKQSVTRGAKRRRSCDPVVGQKSRGRRLTVRRQQQASMDSPAAPPGGSAAVGRHDPPRRHASGVEHDDDSRSCSGRQVRTMTSARRGASRANRRADVADDIPRSESEFRCLGRVSTWVTARRSPAVWPAPDGRCLRQNGGTPDQANRSELCRPANPSGPDRTGRDYCCALVPR